MPTIIRQVYGVDIQEKGRIEEIAVKFAVWIGACYTGALFFSIRTTE